MTTVILPMRGGLAVVPEPLAAPPAPDWQGRGAGSYLLRRSAAALRHVGRTEWTLAVAGGNPARHLYEQHGFVVDESLRAER